ncbi:MAG: hypothetical protein ACWGQW_25135, partial [bacterium]
SDRINLENESRTKGIYNGVDGFAFTDVLKIPAIRQDVLVTNENSSVSTSSRQYVTTKHTPVRTVSRVFNLTTGERYTITDQNPDDTGELNTTGRIQVTGRTLPTASDVLQVDYTWVYEFDPHVDFNDFDPRDSLVDAQDSVDWGYSNYIRDERVVASLDAYNNLTVTTRYPISRLLSMNTFVSQTSTVVSSTAGKTLTVSTAVENVESIKDTSVTGSPEVYNTALSDGNFSNLIITLPSDTIAEGGDTVEVLYNLNNVLDTDGYDNGLVLNRQVTLVPYTLVPNGTTLSVNYVANLPTVMSQTNLSALPVSTDGENSFSGVDGYQPILNDFVSGSVEKTRRYAPTHLRMTAAGIPNL